MARTSWSRRVLLLVCLTGVGCGEGATPSTHSAPSEGVVPTHVNGSSGSGGSSDPNTPSGGDGGGGDAPGAGEAGSAGAADGGFQVGTELRIDVAVDVPTFVQLRTARAAPVAGDYQVSGDWDLAFQGWDIFTNGGVSGSGKGEAFGPLPFTYFVAGQDPTDVPFLSTDKTAGAFRDWYFYDGETHALYSRFHSYGVRRGERLYKVQLLGYYGEVQGAPISALYHLRYAEVTPSGNGPLVEVTNLNATAGGLGGDADAAGRCLTLETGEQQALSPKDALTSAAWDLCFRRDTVSVNGELGGPGGVTAVDLDAGATEGETLDSVKKLSAEHEAGAFNAVDYAALTAPGLKYHGDRVVSAFSDAWADTAKAPPELPNDSTWLVVGSDGKSRFLVGFTGLQDSTAEAAGRVVMRIQQVR